MGVQARVVVYARDAAEADRAGAGAFRRLDELEAVMSDYRPDSELMRLCEHGGGEPVPVSEDLLAVLGRSLEIARATGGAFDPTLGPVVALWREARVTGKVPDAERLKAARALTGWSALVIDSASRTARLTCGGMRLDVGGIGKGFAAHEAAKAVKAAGVSHCLVALAGDIALGDPPPGAAGWRIVVERTGQTVPLANACISTSGDTEQFIEFDGVRYSHVLDPATGLGLTRRVQATVIARDGATADALATALCVLGRDRAADTLARFPGVEALIIEGTPEGAAEFRSPGFPLLSPAPSPDRSP